MSAYAATKAVLMMWSVYTTFANSPVSGYPTPGVVAPTVTMLEFSDMAKCEAARATLWQASVSGSLKGRTFMQTICLDIGKQKGD